MNTFFKYKVPDAATIDTSTLFLKQKSEAKSVLCTGMDHHGLCAAVLLKIAGGSFDWTGFCCDEFPAEVFSGELWTPAVACERGFISEGHRDKMELEPARWKEFLPIITSELDLAEASAKLHDKIPHYDKLAILVVDPASIAQG